MNDKKRTTLVITGLFAVLLFSTGINHVSADIPSFDVSWSGDSLPESNGVFTATTLQKLYLYRKCH